MNLIYVSKFNEVYKLVNNIIKLYTINTWK